jgi:[acyl-carrier-protein] S-malonyltransferase
MTRAIVFPGQGAQKLQMGKPLAEAFPAARHVFEEVDDALGQKLSAVMWGEDDEALKLTENTQPALMAVSLAVVRVLEGQGGFQWGKHAIVAAGHSLGEYSALTAAGALGLADCARLLKRRGQAMARAVAPGVGAMALAMGAEMEQAEKLAAAASAAGEICEVANDNNPGGIVLSGHKAAVERTNALCKDYGVRRMMPVAVNTPFHCSLMAPAAREMDEVLAKTAIAVPKVPVIANVNVEAVSDPDTIRRLLVAQITGRVRWRETVLSLRGRGVTEMAEVGAGKILTAAASRTDAELRLVNVETPADIDVFLKTL